MSNFELYNPQGKLIFTDDYAPHSRHAVESVITGLPPNLRSDAEYYDVVTEHWKRLNPWKGDRYARSIFPSATKHFPEVSTGITKDALMTSTSIVPWYCLPDNVMFTGSFFPLVGTSDFVNNSTYPSRILCTSSLNNSLIQNTNYLQIYNDSGASLFNLSDNTLVGNVQAQWTWNANEVSWETVKNSQTIASVGASDYKLIKRMTITSKDNSPLYVMNAYGVFCLPTKGEQPCGLIFSWNVDGTTLLIDFVAVYDTWNKSHKPPFFNGACTYTHSFPILSFPNVII